MKQELLNFILANVTDTMKLKTTEHLNDGRKGTKIWLVSRDRTYTIIRDNFNSELIGHTPGDTTHIITIDSWEVVPLE